ncbi:MAG: CSLREA domain-containing protein [Paracoccaceae bacterium]|nr:CSLREA domain-containing protein [Paracoccaceae bacterium]
MVETPGLVVTTLADTVADDGETSLREAIAFANSDADASAISFDQSLSGQTIILSGSELVLSSEVTIDGDINGDTAAHTSQYERERLWAVDIKGQRRLNAAIIS